MNNNIKVFMNTTVTQPINQQGELLFKHLMDCREGIDNSDGLGKFVSAVTVISPAGHDLRVTLPQWIDVADEIHLCVFILEVPSMQMQKLVFVDSDLTCNLYPVGIPHLNSYYLNVILDALYIHGTEVVITSVSKIPVLI